MPAGTMSATAGVLQGGFELVKRNPNARRAQAGMPQPHVALLATSRQRHRLLPAPAPTPAGRRLVLAAALQEARGERWERREREGRGDRRERGERGERGRRGERKERGERGERGEQPSSFDDAEDKDAADLKMWMDRLAGMRPTARTVAVLQLLRIEQEGAFAGLVGGSPGADADEQSVMQPWRTKLDDRDVRTVTELVNGVTRWRRRLDYVLERLTRKDIGTLDPPLRQILRLGLYELAEMQAASHTVNEHVELAKKVMHQGAASVTNGVLRNVVRRLQSGSLEQPPAPSKGMTVAQAAEALAVGASHPTWLVNSWLRQYGPAATMRLLKHNNSRPHHALRLAPGLDPAAVCQQLQEKEVQAQPSRYLPSEFITVTGGLQALLTSGMLKRGEAQVQDEAAGLVVAMLDPQPGETILDACAAPGGKTLFSAARMQGRGSITALDLSSARLAALRDTAERQGYSGIVKTVAADLRRFAWQQSLDASSSSSSDRGSGSSGSSTGSDAAVAGSPGGGGSGRQPWQYDRVLLDAPCSGTGVLAKRADLRWRRQPEEVSQLAGLQQQLLHAAATLVAPGGLLVYSTCSIEAEENQQQVAAFLQSHPEFELEAVPAGSGVPPQCLSEDGCLRMLPHVHGTDGAFAARLRRSA